eukprot:GHUV01038107.1.p1 GENE.GHUV01038107.1~~GHUV01038107.1.p1  ORF type:complete len:316 (+),score=86.66 GHUV01038107.1:990-1937(+)
MCPHKRQTCQPGAATALLLCCSCLHVCIALQLGSIHNLWHGLNHSVKFTATSTGGGLQHQFPRETVLQLIVTLKPDAKGQQHTPQGPPNPQPHRQPGEPLSSGQLHLHETDNSHVPLASRATRQAVVDLVGRHLSGLRPEEEGKYTIRYAVPRRQQSQLIELLQVIEKGAAGETAEAEVSGIADVQLSLTSLEEVFLTIAKQAELEAASVTGATVSVQLPDTGKEVQVPIGQDWYEEWQATKHGNVQVRYLIKWVQDDSGALTVLQVSPAKPRQPPADGGAGSSTGSLRAVSAPSSPRRMPGTSSRSDLLAPVAP